MQLSNIFTVWTDIRNLYSSRDGLWSELFRLQKTSKRRDSEARQRIHQLERRLKKLEGNLERIVEFYRGIA